MIRSLRVMLLTVLTILCGSAFAQEEQTVTWLASSGDALTTINVGNDIKLNWEEGGGDMAPKYSGEYVYFYNGNRVTVAGASSEVKIKKVVFSFKDETKNGLSTCDKSGKNVSNTGISNDNDALTTTWEGEQGSVIFRAAAQTGVRYIKSIAVTYTGVSTEAKAPVLNISNANIADNYDMDTNPVFVVYYGNTGTEAAQNAKLTLYVDGTENVSQSVGTLAFGKTDYWNNFKYDLTNITAGEHQVYISLTADNAEPFSTTPKTVTFTKKAPEATFELTAQDVEVEFGAETITATVNVKNTSEVNATNVVIQLWRNGQIATQTIESLAAGANQNVEFTFNNPFSAAGTYEIQALTSNNKYGCKFNITVKEEVVAEVKDLAISAIEGTIKLGEAANSLRVTVQNNGNVNITDAAVVLKNGDTTLGEGTVSANAGQQGWTTIAVSKEGLVAGTINVTATVTVEGDATPDDNTMTKDITVEAAPVPEATYSVTAENVTVAYGAESFNITATVKNTSEVDATNVAVKLLKGATEVETKTIETLNAGAEAQVTFTLTEIEAGKTVSYFVQANNKAQAEVEVTFEAAPVAQVVDINLIDIRGISEINLKEETHTAMVTFSNQSNFDVENATITLKMNGNEVGTQTIAKNETSKTFTLNTEGLEAGQEVTLVATLNAENNKEGNTVEVSKTVKVVSGEAEPQAEIMINPIRGWEVEAGEQEIAVTVSVFNQGDADAKDVKIELYHSYGDGLCEAQTVDIAKGGYKMLSFKFNYTFEQGKSYDFTVFTNFKDGNTEDNRRTFTITCPAPAANVSIAKIAKIEATTADDVKIAATLTNNSSFAAKEVKVGVYKVENFQYQHVGIMQTIEEIAAGENHNVEFNLGKLEAGNYTYYVRISSVNGTTTTTQRDVEVKVTEPVVETIEVALTAIQGISNIDLAEGANNTITVWAENTGNVDAEATIGVTLNDNALESQTITLKAGKNGGASFTLPTEGLVAGTTANVVATLTVEGNTSEATTLAKDYNVVNSSVATEPVFEITAAPVEVEFGVEKFNVAATVKNTSTVGATNVEVKLYYNGDIATQTIAALAANAESEVTFADVTNPFTKAGTYTMYVMAPKAQAEVTVTVKPEPVVEKVDVAVFDLRGLNNIDLAAESNTVSVWVANNGNVDAEATISVTLNSTTLEAQTVNVKATKDADSPTYADASFILPTDGLVAGEKATVVATVTVADNTSENTTITREYDIVNSSVATEPVFEITAAPVEVEFGAEKFNVVATVKNASTVNATDVEVKLYYNGEIATQTIATLTANAEAEVIFADVENPFTKAGTYTMYVRAPKAQAEVTVTVKPEPVVETIDLAVTSINGTLSLDIESNYLTVWVENKGNVDVNGAAVSLMAGETTLGTGTVNVKAGNNAFCSIAVAADMLQEGEFTVTAKVTAEGDVDETNNELSRTYTIEAPKAALSFTAEAQVLKDMLSYTVLVNVTNESTKADAENIEVKLYTENSKELTSAIIKKIAAGTTSSVVLSGVAEEALSGSILVMVNGSTSYVSLEVVDVITSINTVKAQMANGTLRVYTLNGKKAETVKSGSVYIINGKKVMVK